MNNIENTIEIVGFDGVKITELTIDEFNKMIQLFDELFSTEPLKFREMLINGQSEEIKEDFLDIYNPDATHHVLANNESEKEILKSLYSKLKQASTKQIIYIITTLLNSHDFLYMFRFGRENLESEVKKEKLVFDKSNIINILYSYENYRKAGLPYGEDGHEQWKNEKVEEMKLQQINIKNVNLSDAFKPEYINSLRPSFTVKPINLPNIPNGNNKLDEISLKIDKLSDK